MKLSRWLYKDQELLLAPRDVQTVFRNNTFAFSSRLAFDRFARSHIEANGSDAMAWITKFHFQIDFDYSSIWFNSPWFLFALMDRKDGNFEMYSPLTIPGLQNLSYLSIEFGGFQVPWIPCKARRSIDLGCRCWNLHDIIQQWQERGQRNVQYLNLMHTIRVETAVVTGLGSARLERMVEQHMMGKVYVEWWTQHRLLMACIGPH